MGPWRRPDIEPYKARSSAEALPSIHVTAKATLKYPDDPKKLLPSWVFDLPVPTIEAYISVTPTLEASVAGQLTIGSGEGSNYVEAKEFSFSARRFASASLVAGMRAAASFTVVVRLVIKVTATFDFFVGPVTIKLVNIDKTIPVPLGGSSSSSQAFIGAAVSTGGEVPETLDGVRTLHGVQHMGAAPSAAFIEQCYAPSQPPANEVKTEPPEKGDPKDLFGSVLWPCNICIASAAVFDKGTPKHPAHADTITKSNPPPTPPHWKCDHHVKSGCMDLCTQNSATQALTIARLPKQIANGLPANHPQKELFSKICDSTIVVPR